MFSYSKEPLYGRIKRKLDLKPLSFDTIIKMCNALNIHDIEEIIKLYAVFGGFPKYYVSIEDEHLNGKTFEEIIFRLFLVENAILEDEVSQILSLEFGKRSGLYYDILTAIANGNTRISEIASFLRKKETALTRQVNELTNYFELVGVEESVVNRKKSLFIKHSLMNFWFRFFYKNLSAYKIREKWLIERIKNEINTYIGKQFENVCKESLNKVSPVDFEKMGRWWGYYRDEKTNERKTVEIDLLALNEKTKEILFCECKWQDKTDARKISNELKEKAKIVDWNKNKRKEYYLIFAKSFKEKIKEENLILVDLKDLEENFK